MRLISLAMQTPRSITEPVDGPWAEHKAHFRHRLAWRFREADRSFTLSAYDRPSTRSALEGKRAVFSDP